MTNSYLGMADGLELVTRKTLPAPSLGNPGWFCLYSQETGTYFGRARRTLAEATEDANRVNTDAADRVRLEALASRG